MKSQMSYSMVSAPSDLFGRNSAIHSHRFGASAVEPRRDSDSRSPMSEPRSPIFRPSLVAELPPHFATLYNSPYAAAAVAAAVAGQGAAGSVSQSAYSPYARSPATPMFYPGMVNADVWRRSPYLSQLDFCWPQGLRSLEAMMGPRTKAPREATSILKSWLSDHKDNPYPTKNEKMTLSLVTHMTLTQVSTWFANARRRIKKENKMTWTPKTRCGERDGSSSNDDESEKDYHRRSFSPFKNHSMNGGVPRREHNVEKRLLCPNSVPNFPKLPLPYYNAAASLQGAFKQHISSKQLDNSHAQGKKFFALAKSSDSDFDKEKTSTEEKRLSPPSLVKKFDFDKPKETISKSETDSLSQNAQLPFVRLSHKSHGDEKIDSCNRETTNCKQEQTYSAKQEHVKILDTSDDEETRSPFPTSESPGSEKGSVKKDNKNAIPTDNSMLKTCEPFDDRDQEEQNSPSNFRPITIASNMTTNSAMSEKQDPLSCWIRDFQQLVTSGQELKAKQALASALAVAAKAGAYSGRNSLRPPPHFHPLQPEAYKTCPSSFERVPPTASEDSVPFPSDEQKQYRKRKRENDITTTPPKLRREHASPSEASDENVRSPIQGPISLQENSPINLTKASLNRAWKRENLTADDARIEA